MLQLELTPGEPVEIPQLGTSVRLAEVRRSNANGPVSRNPHVREVAVLEFADLNGEPAEEADKQSSAARYLVRLKPSWPGQKRRSVRFDPATGAQVLAGGEIDRVIEFAPGEVVELDEVEMRAVSADVGVCIEHVRLDEKGRPRVSEDPVEIAGVAEPTAEPHATPAARRKAGTSARAPDETGDDPEIDIPPQIVNALHAADLHTTQDVVNYLDSGRCLTDLKGIGDKSAETILRVIDGMKQETTHRMDSRG